MSLFLLARPARRATAVCRFTSNLTVAQLVERGTVNATAVIPRSMVRIRPVRFPLAEWPSGLRRWFKAPVSSEARVRISLQSLFCPGRLIPIVRHRRWRRGPLNHSEQRSGAAEARWAHNPKVGGSKPAFATFCETLHPVRRFGRVVKALAC